MKRLLCMTLAILLCLCSLCGCEQEKPEEKRNSASTANSYTGGGLFAYRDGFIYFADLLNLYEYDMVSGKTVTLAGTSISSLSSPSGLHVTEDRVYFKMNSALNYITRDGKERGQISSAWGSTMCTDGIDMFFKKSGNLIRRNLETGVEEVLWGKENGKIYTYALSNDKIYLTIENVQHRDYSLWMSDRENIDFQEVSLPESVEPYKVCAVADCVYFSILENGGNLYRYQDGKVEELPFPTGPYYQVVGNKLISRDKGTTSKTRSKMGKELSIRDLNTGEKTVIDDSASYFVVFEERYVCYWRPDEVHQQWYYYDLQTGQTTLMYEILDSEKQFGYSIG